MIGPVVCQWINNPSSGIENFVMKVGAPGASCRTDCAKLGAGSKFLTGLNRRLHGVKVEKPGPLSILEGSFYTVSVYTTVPVDALNGGTKWKCHRSADVGFEVHA